MAGSSVHKTRIYSTNFSLLLGKKNYFRTNAKKFSDKSSNARVRRSIFGNFQNMFMQLVDKRWHLVNKKR
jgi:hypothetical protein